MKIYVENGSLSKEIKNLNKLDNIELIYFSFENKINRIKKIDTASFPTNLTWDNNYITFDSLIRFSDCDESEKYTNIERIVGKNNSTDINHIDTAYKEGCKIFITNDKDDISNKADEIFNTTGMRVFYYQDIEQIIKYINDNI